MHYSNNCILRSCLNNTNPIVNSCTGTKFSFLVRFNVSIFKFQSPAAFHRILQDSISAGHNLTDINCT